MMIAVLSGIESIVGKGENANNQYFPPFFHSVFKNPLLQGVGI